MSLIKKNIKIATILPYKENYTHTKASAASLWVAEFFKKSKYNKTNHIYGHTKNRDYLTNNYFNIELANIKSKLKSAKGYLSKNENDIYKYLEIQNEITIEKELGLFDQFVKLYSDILNNKIKNFEYSKYEDLIYRYKFINNLHKGQ